MSLPGSCPTWSFLLFMVFVMMGSSVVDVVGISVGFLLFLGCLSLSCWFMDPSDAIWPVLAFFSKFFSVGKHGAIST